MIRSLLMLVALSSGTVSTGVAQEATSDSSVRFRVTIGERALRPKSAPAPILTISTISRYACLGYRIEHSITTEGDTLSFELLGIARPRDICLNAVGHATLSHALDAVAGRYVVRVRDGDKMNHLSVVVTDSSAALVGGETSFLNVDERLRWRYPERSFALFCGTIGVADSVCDEVQSWLARQSSISEKTFGSHGLNPFYSPDPARMLSQRVSVFLYDTESALESVRLCFAEVEDAISEAVGISLMIRTWLNERIMTASRRANHEPHIDIPENVTAGTGCR